MSDVKSDNLLKNFDVIVDEKKHEMRYNIVCLEIIDVIFDKVIDMMNKDKNVKGFHKTLVVNTAKNSKEPVKKYVLKMNGPDAIDIINKIDTMIKDL